MSKKSEISFISKSYSPNHTQFTAQKFVDSSIYFSSNLSFFLAEDRKQILSALDSFEIFSSCKYSKKESTNLVNVLKTKDVALKSYETVRTKILNGQKFSYPLLFPRLQQ